MAAEPSNPIAAITTAAGFRAFAQASGADVPIDDEVLVGPDSPLARPMRVGKVIVGNRLSVMPLEGWDAGGDGTPSEATSHRWASFGRSGSKLLWTESVAVSADARSTPRQLMIDHSTLPAITSLRETLTEAHHERFGSTEDLAVGVQLHHSGRLNYPGAGGTRGPLLVQHHPFLDEKYHVDAHAPLATDDELWSLVDVYAKAARYCQEAGFHFVDVKACHGYLIHELLTAHTRAGVFGGAFENRSRFLLETVKAIRTSAPELALAVRVSAFDVVPHRAGDDEGGVPVATGPYPYVFGALSADGTPDLSEATSLLVALRHLGVVMVCVSGGSPYATWHLQRPAWNRGTSDYDTPEPPLVGVARHLRVTASLKAAVPELVIVGSAYSATQQWLPNVAQAVLRLGMSDAVGYARAHLSNPELAVDVLSGRGLQASSFASRY